MMKKGPIIIHNIEKFGSIEFSERQDTFYRKWLHDYPVTDYVYVIRDRDVTGFYKIGRTINPFNRLTNFDVKLPFGIYIIAIIPVAHGAYYENYFHDRFIDKRVSGEWYSLDAEDILDFKLVELRYPVLTSTKPNPAIEKWRRKQYVR